MKPGDRVKVSEFYGERFPLWKHYVGELGTFHKELKGDWEGYLEVTLDIDGESGLFSPDEIDVTE